MCLLIHASKMSPAHNFLQWTYCDAIKRWTDYSFLSWLHLILLLDDIAILATTWEHLHEKYDIMNEFDIPYDMAISNKILN